MSRPRRTAPVLYNEFDAYPAAWLRNLAAAGHIAPGVVDDRSIEALTPADVAGRVQAHFFAGIGVWSYALRLAGWPDDRPVWTGSCPCQPFSQAGRGKGFDDERHLWPAWFELIRECRPPVVFGEQVASPDGLMWFDTVRADLEDAGYAVGVADLCAAGVGAPHLRQRLFFGAYRLADAGEERRDRLDAHLPFWRPLEAGPEAARGGAALGAGPTAGAARALGGRGDGEDRLADAGEGGRGSRLADAGAAGNELHVAGGRTTVRLADADEVARRQGGAFGGRGHPRGDAEPRPGPRGGFGTGAPLVGLADADEVRLQGVGSDADPEGRRGPLVPAPRLRDGAGTSAWADPDWLPCRDGKARPVEPGTFPLAHGAPARVGRLRAYGNAIVGQVAATFVSACMDALDSRA